MIVIVINLDDRTEKDVDNIDINYAPTILEIALKLIKILLN